MSDEMYRWRKMTPDERTQTLLERRRQNRPWHSLPHRESDAGWYLITGTCYEHEPYIGFDLNRMFEFESALIESVTSLANDLTAWVVLPNHYHLLLQTTQLVELLKEFGRLHGRTSYRWNFDEKQKGRKVWSGVVETAMKSEHHFWATVNDIHHNPVKHGYVERWQEWPFGNATEYLESVGTEQAARAWKDYPILDYGKGWDE